MSQHQPSPSQIANKLNGSKGGKARALKLSAERRSEIASKAGTACKDAYGLGIFSHISKKRKTVGRYRKPVYA